MFLKALTLLLALGSALALLPQQSKINPDRSLVDYLMQPRGVGNNNPAQQTYCFNRYLPILKDIADQYEVDYSLCVEAYQLECAAIDTKYAFPRENVTEIAKRTCQVLQKCDGYPQYIDVFECFEATAAEQSKVLFNLSADSGAYAGQLRELYRVAESTGDACINAAYRVYWENTSKTYDELTNCLDGVVNEPGTATLGAFAP